MDWQRLFGIDIPDTSFLLDKVQSFLPDPDAPYGRRPLYRDADGEVLLVAWSEAVECAPHDHGSSAGRVLLLRGTFIEKHWGWRRRELQPLTMHQWGAGAVLNVTGIHSMQAVGCGVSLHLYTPAITMMRVYDPQSRRTFVVSDDCGAWIPRDHTQIVSVEDWSA